MKSAWLEKYQEALLELEPEKLARRIEIAERAIRERVEELGTLGVACGEEHHALDDALRALRVLAKTQCNTLYQREYDSARNEEAS
jgi:inhibitor of KinA sporulation pathway (predicted exonuclease)